MNTKRIIILSLCFCLIICAMPIYASAKNCELQIACASSEEDQAFTLSLTEIDGVLCIPTSDVSRISGFEHSGEYFSCGGSRVKLKIIEHNGQDWVPFTQMATELGVQVNPIKNALYCQAYGAAKARVQQLAKSVIMDDAYRFRIDSSNDNSLNQGVVLSIIYDSLSINKSIDMISGEYGRDVDKSVLLDILSEDHDEALSFLNEVTGTFSDLTKVLSIYDEDEIQDDPLLIFGYVYRKSMDPISTITKDNVFSIQGLGLRDIMDVYTHFESISYISESRANMFRFTIGSDKIGGPGSSIRQKTAMFPVSYWSQYLPSSIDDILKQYVSMFDSDEYSAMWSHFVKQSLVKTASGKVEDIAKDLSGMGSYYRNTDIAKVVFQNISKYWFGEDYRGAMNTSQKIMVLSEIQEMARRLYTAYASYPDNEINIKYCALLYLRCCRVFCDYAHKICDDLDTSAYISIINSTMTELYAIPDEYLIGATSCSAPDLQTLISISESQSSKKHENTSGSPDLIQPAEFQVEVNDSAGELIVRSGPSTEYPEVERIPGGQLVVVYEVAVTDGVEWGNIGAGWICLDYTTRTSEVVYYDRAVLMQFIGAWGDRIGMRCMMDVYPTDSGHGLKFELKWGNSAFSTRYWEFIGIYDEATQTFKYTDGLSYTTNSTEHGYETIEHYRDGSGFFFIEDGYMYWVDEKEDAGAQCCFEKTE